MAEHGVTRNYRGRGVETALIRESNQEHRCVIKACDAEGRTGKPLPFFKLTFRSFDFTSDI